MSSTVADKDTPHNASDSEENCESLTGIVDEVQEKSDGEMITFGEILDTINQRGFGPLLLIPALFSASPLGAIPGMSIVTGSLIICIAIQMMFCNGHPWVPQRLEEFEFEKDKLDNAIAKARPWTKWLDKFIHERFTFLVEGPMKFVIALTMVLLSISYYPLALVPFAVFIPAMGNIFFATAISARDGVLSLFAFLTTGVTLYFLLTVVPNA